MGNETSETFKKALMRYPSLKRVCADQGYRGTFENYFEDTMSPTNFSEMWDNVKEDERWD